MSKKKQKRMVIQTKEKRNGIPEVTSLEELKDAFKKMKLQDWEIHFLESVFKLF